VTTVTIKDVAREAKVSVASVSRALNGSGGVTAETERRIREVAARLRYVPHSAARSLITRRTHTIGALLPDLYGEFFSELIRGIDQAARARGLHLLVSSSHDGVEDAAAALQAMRGRVDGMLILSSRADLPFLQANLPESLPTVLLNSAVRSPHYSVLNIDNEAGARAMVRHLVDCGLHDIAFIGGPEGNFDAQQREHGYRSAMAELAPDGLAQVIPGDFTEEAGYRAGRQLLAQARRPQAVFAGNDMMAIGCLYALKEAGLDIPREMAVTGFDDIPVTRYVSPPLTTVRVRIVDLGRSALERLAALLDASDQTPVSADTLGCEIVVRDSCGARGLPPAATT
jgi:LacI family transcriptional regulator